MPENSYQGLVCISCGKIHDGFQETTCKSCGGLLTGLYGLDNSEIDLSAKSGIWQFRNMFPPVSEKNITSMGEGWTPYIKAGAYGKATGADDLWLKLEGLNPSGSFKDRVASLEISLLREWGKNGVFTASSGNAAAAISAYAARAGLKCLLLVREDSTASKLGQISMYDPTIVRVRGLFETKQRLFQALESVQKALPDWHNGFVWAPFNPLALDALKTVAYEIATVNVPDYVFVPTAGGDLLYGIFKGFTELRKMGYIEKVPSMVAVQGAGANPLVQAIEKDMDSVADTETADTVAGALRVNFGEVHPLEAIKKTGGFGISVSDEEIINAQRELAKQDGVFAEMSSAAAAAAVKKAISNGTVKHDDKIAAILTGSGFKDYRPGFSSIDHIPLMSSVDELAKKIRELA